MKRLLLIIFIVALVACSVPAPPAVDLTVPSQYKLYLPLVYKGKMMPGVQIESEHLGSIAKDYLNPSGIYKVTVKWNFIEIAPGVYTNAYQSMIVPGINPTWVDFHTTPAWARENASDPMCKLPARIHWDDFVDFVNRMIRLLHPEIVGFWNEPDTYDTWAAEWLGCVGDPKLYSDFANYVAPRIVGAKVVIGNVITPRNGFLEDVIGYTEWNPAIYGYSFHHYVRFNYAVNEDLLADPVYAQSLTFKPTFLSETAVYYVAGSADAYYWWQVEYFDTLYSNLDNYFFWYNMLYHGWPWDGISTDMMSKGNDPRPVYNRYFELR